MKKVRVASVGLGWVTCARHLPTMRSNPHFDIVGLVDTNKERLATEKKRWRARHTSSSGDLASIEWIDDVDAITIGTAPMSHYQLIHTALSMGKHVLTEKPFAMTVSEGAELTELAESKGLRLGVVHNFQFASSTQRFLRDYENGKIGPIQSIQAVQLGNPNRRLPTWYEQLPLGLFYDESPHFFYLLRRLSPGNLTFLKANVFKSTKNLRTPAAIFAHYACESPHGTIPVNMILNFESPVSEWHFAIFGENSLADIDVFRDIYLRLPNDGLHTTKTVFKTSLTASLQHWGQHLTSGARHLTGTLRYGNETVFNKFARSILFDEPLEDISAEDGLEVLKMQHQLIEQHELLTT